MRALPSPIPIRLTDMRYATFLSVAHHLSLLS